MVELKKTSYKHKKMAILSDREYTCIQHTTRNKTDLCNELLDPMTYKGCAFYNEFNNKTISTFQAAESRGLAPLWDIEDLVTIGKKEGSCPYFAARSLAEEADIIICPYRYIISTDIRESLQIDLKGQVIILDDAHGVEQNSKYASSTSFREDHLQIVKIECEKLVEVKLDGNHEAYKILCLFVTRMLEFLGSVDLIHENVGNPTHIRMSSFWTGPELAELLSIHSMDKSLCEAFINACDTAISDMNKAKEESRFRKLIKPVISSATKKELDHLVFTVRMINLINYTNDYRACVSETIVNDLVTPYSSKWLPTEQHTRILQLFSMNSGVVFEPLAQNARSVILASGSLSPMETYQGELRTSFPNVLKTRHVVPKEQVYATCIPYGPSKLILRGICSNMNTWSYQDEIGRVLLDICESMPHGILCFFSSHDVMHKHVERWRSTSIFDKISNVKPVFFEPECETNLVPMLAKYCYVIRRTSAKKVGNVTGALLLAVFGGKVAEGVYFRDNEARCVVAIGMPYPGNQNYIIRLKMAYNDKNIKNGFLKGSDWFSIQAFRALNQALERCLRHVHDWGALLLIDDRFLQDEYKQNLSEWIKTMWVNPTEYTLKKDLEHFVARQKMRDAKQPGISN
ncbi:hypothetical protein K0M31_018663 [Melipona bicolor]|uniref:Helicase ATP-binding domain-containing protein n=1 Tax=Melipona bicolor TaxID=60889 RepID=A0AA40KS52_9HYME|nr:hypothetical protein K0M31_018663 [Melipona bicolor]